MTMSDAWPVTLWYSTLGVGDGHDFATRGYLDALMAAGYEGIRIPPSVSTALTMFDTKKDPSMERFMPLARPPQHLRMAEPQRVQAGDPRIGTSQRIQRLDDDGNPIKDNFGDPVTEEIIIAEGSIDPDAKIDYTVDAKTAVRCVVIHHDPTSICRNYANMVKLGKPSGVAYVGVTVWETSSIPDQVALMLSELDLIVVPSEHTARAFRESGLATKMAVVPHSFDAKLWPQPTLEETVREREKYIFYAIATPIERKNLKGLVRAYFVAFQGRQDVQLRIKSIGERSALERLAREALEESGVPNNERPPIKLFTGEWSTEKIRAFHLDGDCCVSADRGEGFGLVPFEAKLCGSRVITTGWGAATEFLKHTSLEIDGKPNGHPYRGHPHMVGAVRHGTGSDILVPYKLVPVSGMYGIGCYAPDQEWADPEHDALVEAMREAATQRLGPDLEAWARLNKKFGVDTIGTQLSALLHKARDEAAEEESDDDWE
jgi:glycosyltransferase involved in cell wall biosynthesis